jgi:hypothetical protein
VAAIESSINYFVHLCSGILVVLALMGEKEKQATLPWRDSLQDFHPGSYMSELLLFLLRQLWFLIPG